MGTLALLAALGLAGTLTSVGVSAYQSKKDREFNSAEAEKQRSFEEEMSSTAYQRSVADMKEAGLNPAMMYANGGQGASTPTGSSAVSHSNKSLDMSGIAAIINSAAALTKNKNMSSQTTQQIYNSAGNLMKTVETYARNV